MTVFDSHQPWGAPHRGLQLFGVAKLTTSSDHDRAFAIYADRHTELLQLAATSQNLLTGLESRLYEVTVSRLKLIDEVANGPETTVTLEVARHDR